MKISQNLITMALILLSFFHIKTTSAQITTDRPSQSDNSYVLEKGYLQVESALNYSWSKSNPYTYHQFSLPTTSIRYGINSKFELRLGAEYTLNIWNDNNPNTYNTSFSQFQHLQIGTKIQLLKRVAWISHALIPVDKSNPQLLGQLHKISATFPLNKKTSITSNLVYRRLKMATFNEAIPFYSFMATLNIWSQITPKLMIFSEPYLYSENNNTPALNFNAGFAYIFHQNHQIDLSAGTTVLSPYAPWSFVSFGYSFRFKK